MPPSIRVSDLARELGMEPAELLKALQSDFGLRVRTVSSALQPNDARKVRARLRLAKRRAARPNRRARAEENIRRAAEQRLQRVAAETKAAEEQAKEDAVRKEKEEAEARARAEREEEERKEREERRRVEAERRAAEEAEAAEIRRTAEAARKQAELARAAEAAEAKAAAKADAPKPAPAAPESPPAKPEEGDRAPKGPGVVRRVREPFTSAPTPTGRRIETPSIASPARPGQFRPGATDRKIVPTVTPPARRATPPRLRATPPPLRRSPGMGPKARRPAPGRRSKARRRVGPAEVPDTADGLDSQFPPGLRQAISREYRTSAEVELGDAITVKGLAEAMSIPISEVIKALLLDQGVAASINQVLDADTAEKLVVKFGGTTSTPDEVDEGALAEAHSRAEEAQALRDQGWVERAPVVTVMGHVDHGKTSVLDAIRSTRVVAGEAGGITQHVSAYTVDTEDGRRIVFLDTPGHEAFTKMRARGASVTDVVILVVAADDGVKEQTIEALNHARAAEVPIVVAVNKMDLPAADPDQVMRQLSERGVNPEEWGGDTIFCRVSAKTHEGLPEMLAAVLDVAELEEPLADPRVPAEGVVLEARKDRGRGPVAQMLVQSGTLKVGATLSAGAAWGKVRALLDGAGKRLKSAPPSTPVEVLGLTDVPVVGDRFTAAESAAEARRIAEERQDSDRMEVLEGRRRLNLQNLYSQLEGGLKELSIVVKADVGGTSEAVRDSLLRLSTDEVKVRVIHTAAGAVSESDVNLAAATDSIVVAFGVRPDPQARRLAEREGVEIRAHNVIYHLVEEIEKALTGLLEPETEIVELGRIEVRRTFSVPRVGTVAGSYVLSGAIPRSAQVRLVRDGRIVHQGRIGSLRRFKEDVARVREGFECGVGIAGYNDVKIGDIIEAFEQKQVEVSA